MSETTTAEKAIDQGHASSESASFVDVERNVPAPQDAVASAVAEIAAKTSVKKGTKTSFSIWSKIYYTSIPCFLAYLITFSASVVAPATTTFMAEFHVSRTVALLSGTVYLLGLSFGPMFLAPISELVGRRWLYVVTSASIVVFAAGAGACHTFAGFLVCRFLCGFFGSSGIAIGAGTIFDVWGLTKARGLATLLFIYGPFMGPSMGPLAGAYIMHEHGGDWRWTQWLIALIGAPIFVLILFMKETSTTRVQGGGHNNKKKSWLGVAGQAVSLLQAAVVRSTTMLTTEAIAFSITLYTGYAYAVVFSFFASGSYVFLVDYGFDERQVGLVFLGVFVGYVLAAVLHIVVEKTLYARAERLAPAGQRPAPEHRLYSAMAGSIFLPIGLFWYAWSSRPGGGNWAVVAASGIPFGIGAFVLFLSSIMYLVESYGPSASASALAANGSIRYMLGAVFPLFTIQMYETLGVHWAGSVFAFLSLALLPIPWLLFKYGHKLRQNSRFVPASATTAPAVTATATTAPATTA
ncbi:hypothetical protein HMPREF1624_05698 [Sporothrix schenckii ATCC 58251]|uniref:Major facilitator superfamily (MFS) profile domain-containing protein n=1 Tax=Sporothrix schenckii (strain ATCC 58251 / de Perez 2211183) TaxID=1391915 RepID=U7PS14_SPOS1|nr:hypothetical protein HMPREF1624_05698 [Sporothrix schenckii ATCC 58251]